MNNNITYIGEWLWAGNAGHFFALLGMVSAFISGVSYVQAVRHESVSPELSCSWRRLGRISFGINAVSTFLIGIILFFLIFNHRFEFKYVWQHSSLSLPAHYMISCFWEGQEGSFWLWECWTAVIGLVLIRIAGAWESRVMPFAALMQWFLATMLIGLYIGSYKIGSSPFVLMRLDMPEMPLFTRANYLEFLKDGNGLNPLLQNYWMVIHPPTLFLGFASTLVPAAYIMAGLWRGSFDKDWVKPTLAWSLFCTAILGTGILMGGAWAYEALSFGGFWAWDPVENASLVPWITMVAGLHTLLAYKHTRHALHATAILLISTLLLVLYSTFLTRSGILGDSSVHSFTDLGMSGQLLVFLFSFLFLSIGLLVYGWKKMPAPKTEENPYSREFWLFIGALIMLMLAIIISIDTSWPVINKVFGTNRAISDPISHYNRYAVWFALIIGLLSASIQYFRYKKSDVGKWIRSLASSIIISVILTALMAWFIRLDVWVYILLLFAATYSIVANTHYLFVVLLGKIRIAGASVAHIGFGLILLGSLFSSAKKEVISVNTAGIDFGKEFKEKDKQENILLDKDVPVQMGGYQVTYLGDSISAPDRFYKVLYEKKKNPDAPITDRFVLLPNAQVNPKMGLIANPSTKHYWNEDIFTHVTSVPNRDEPNADADASEQLTEAEVAVGDTIVANGSLIVLQAINPRPAHPRYLPIQGDIAAGAKLLLLTDKGKQYQAEPIYLIRDNTEKRFESIIEELNTTILFERILPEKGKIKLSVVEKSKPRDFIIMKAIVFPFINLLWIGCFVMVAGTLISLLHRKNEKIRLSAIPTPDGSAA